MTGRETLDEYEARRSLERKPPDYVPERGETFTVVHADSCPARNTTAGACGGTKAGACTCGVMPEEGGSRAAGPLLPESDAGVQRQVEGYLQNPVYTGLPPLEQLCSVCGGAAVVQADEWQQWWKRWERRGRKEDPEDPAPACPEEIGCGECDATGYLLTDAGRELVGFLLHHGWTNRTARAR